MIGDKLANAMNLFGHPSCINTAKCLQTAGEKGVDIEAHVIQGPDDVLSMSPLGSAPVLKDLDNVVYGTIAIMSYLDDKGFGPSLVPRNGVLRAQMYQWAHIVVCYAQPAASADGGDRDQLTKLYDLLEQRLQSPPKQGGFICGEFTLADIHWSACTNMLVNSGASDLVDSRGAVKSWWDAVKSHPSTSKEKLNPFDVLPTKADMDSGTLRNVAINVL